jgi:hypothetical protein
MDLASPSSVREDIAPTSIQLPPLLVPPVSTEELNVVNPAADGPTSSDSSENNDMASENVVIKDNSGDGEVAPALPDETIPPPSDLAESRDDAFTPAQMKKFEELLEKLQVNFKRLSPDIFVTNPKVSFL